MKIKFAEFVKSATEPRDYAAADKPEVAFAGRSNVGKSSLINTLVNRKNLVRTGKKPGRTQTINFFNVNDELYLVDLPGYGYARVSKSERHAWGPMIETYLDIRHSLKALVCIMDIRRGVEDDDLQLIEAAPHFGVQPILVFTKADKLSKNKRKQRRDEIARGFGGEVDPEELLLFSSTERIGKRALWKQIKVLTGIEA